MISTCWLLVDSSEPRHNGGLIYVVSKQPFSRSRYIHTPSEVEVAGAEAFVTTAPERDTLYA
jgi:hypothetical protein